MNKSDEFIESRIRWRTEKHNLPKTDTYYWESAPTQIRNSLNFEVGKPVLVSLHDELNFIVLCTQGVIVKNNDVVLSTPYNDINSIQSPSLEKNIEKSEINSFELDLQNGESLTIKTEKGAAHFAIRNILLVILKLN